MDLHCPAAVLVARRRVGQPGGRPTQELGVQGLGRHIRQDSPGMDQAGGGLHTHDARGVDKNFLGFCVQHDPHTVVL